MVGHGGGSVAEGLTVIARGTTAEIERGLAEKELTVDYTAAIGMNMKEWVFSNSMIMAQPGQGDPAQGQEHRQHPG